MMWKEIEQFNAAGDYERFIQFLAAMIAKGEIIEVDLDPSTIKISGYRWFKHLASGEIWRLDPPMDDYRGGWRPAAVDPRFMSVRR